MTVGSSGGFFLHSSLKLYSITQRACSAAGSLGKEDEDSKPGPVALLINELLYSNVSVNYVSFIKFHNHSKQLLLPFLGKNN